MKGPILNPFATCILSAGAALALCSAPCARAQHADALLDKLVEKGILSVKEANALREEADKDFTRSFALKTGMPDWVTSFKISGDVRGRYEGFLSDNTFVSGGNTFTFNDRHRFRYRLRIGATISLLDNLEAGLRLTSSEPADRNNLSQGGDPISGNTTFSDNGSKKFIYIDTAYLKWTAYSGPTMSASLTAGKMDNPFSFSDMVFDPDYTPEGAAVQTEFAWTDKHSLKANLGGFILDELDVSSQDPALVGAQARWRATWPKNISSTLGAGLLAVVNPQELSNTGVPNINRGNTRDATGALAYDFHPFVLDASLTYSLQRFPFYKGSFPIRVGGEYMHNPGAPSDADNCAWNAGIGFGKSGKKGTWELSYAYKWLGANAWWEELVDSDFGAFYGQADSPPNSGKGVGYSAGTNVKGHIVRLAYSPADALTLSVKWFYTSLINPFPAGSGSDIHRIQVDGMLRF